MYAHMCIITHLKTNKKITYYSNKPILKLESKIILVFIGFLHVVN